MAARRSNGLKWEEYPAKSGIRIREIINLNAGEAFDGSYQVIVPVKLTGTVRIRKQFKNKQEAKEFADEEFQGYLKQGNEFFQTTDDERREIAICIPKLREHGISLPEATDFAIKRLRPEGGERTINEVVEELAKSKELRYKRGDLRERSYRDFRHRASRFLNAFEGQPVKELDIADIKSWLLGLELAARSTRNYLAVVSEILKFAVQKRYLFRSPTDYLTDVDRKEICGVSQFREPSILTLAEAKRLLYASLENPELELLGAVTLGLFCGIRTEELKRLDWRNVKDIEDAPVVTITGEMAKKRRIRHVDIPENAICWLSFCKNRKGKVARNIHTNDYQKRFRKLLKVAGFGSVDEGGVWRSDWDANAMRHSFGSYHYALHGNPMETARLLGHKASDQVLFDHYRALTKKDDGKKFFVIKPAASAAKVVEFSE